MNYFILIFSLLYFICFSSLGFGQTNPRNINKAFMIGQDLFKSCTNLDASSQNECTGYILGVIDITEGFSVVSNQCMGFMLPSSINIQEIKKLVLIWYKEHPSHLKIAAADGLYGALSNRYPCQKLN